MKKYSLVIDILSVLMIRSDGMTESDMIQFQMDQIDKLMSLQHWIVGIFITIIIAIVGFLGFLQWRLSDKQIAKMKSEIDNELNYKYNLKAINDIENTTSIINKTVSNSIIVLGKQIFSFSGPSYMSILEFRGLVDSLYNFNEIDKSLSIFLLNTINKIIDGFERSETARIKLNKSAQRAKQGSQKIINDQEEIIIDNNKYRQVQEILQYILEIVETKSDSDVLEEVNIELFEKEIDEFYS